MPRMPRHTDETDPVERPPIWVAGRQQPKFAPLAWLKVGTAMTRRWLAPRFDRGSAGVKSLSTQIEGGRFKLRLGWLGKAQRHLPSREAVSRTVAGLAARMAEARLLLLPLPAQPHPLAYPNLIHPHAAHRRTPPSAEAPRRGVLSDPDPAVQAIRAMMHAAVVPEPLTTEPEAKPNPAAARFLPIEPQEPMPPTFAMRLGAHLIAWTSLALTLPVGLVQATLYHLNGGDLNDWD